jgi:hypothetical protein
MSGLQSSLSKCCHPEGLKVLRPTHKDENLVVILNGALFSGVKDLRFGTFPHDDSQRIDRSEAKGIEGPAFGDASHDHRPPPSKPSSEIQLSPTQSVAPGRITMME